MTTYPWPVLPLSELAEVRLGRQRSPKNHSGSQMRPYLRAANVGWNGLILDDVKEMNFTDDEMVTYTLRSGDLLLSEASGSPGEVGKPALWNGELPECAFQNTLLRVRSETMEPAFLLHFFRHMALSGQFVEQSRGVGIHHLGRERLAKWPTPQPPPAEQRRIVAILEEHLSDLDDARRSLQRARSRILELTESSVNWEVESESASAAKLSDLVSVPLSNGRSVRDRADGFPVLRLTAMKSGTVDLSERKNGDWTALQAAAFLVRQGDFMIARGNGSLALVGRGALVDVEPDEVAFPDTMIRARPAPERVEGRWLARVWNSRRVRDQIERVARTSAGIYKLNQAQLNEVLVPLLPIDQQRLAVKRLDAVDDDARRCDEAIGNALARGESLRRSVLAAAFSGRLSGRSSDTDVIAELAEEESA